MSEDINTDIGTAHIALPEHAEAQQAAERASDERLDATVRKAAAEAFSREARPQEEHNKSIDQTLKETYQKIQARPEPPQMPTVEGQSVEQTLHDLGALERRFGE